MSKPDLIGTVQGFDEPQNGTATIHFRNRLLGPPVRVANPVLWIHQGHNRLRTQSRLTSALGFSFPAPGPVVFRWTVSKPMDRPPAVNARLMPEAEPLPFTQYVMPDGRKRIEYITRPEEIESMAKSS